MKTGNENVNVKKWQENINTWLTEIHVKHKMAISVDCVVFGYTGEDLYMLLMKCNMPPFEGMYSLVGDLIHYDESLNTAANRILAQKAGLENVILEQVDVFSAVDRHPIARVVTVAFNALLNIDGLTIKDMENRDLVWVPISDVTELAFDHKKIVDKCYRVLKDQLVNKTLSFKLLPEKFTIKQLQSLMEIVLNIKIDKRNFRRKLNDLNILIEHKEMQTGVNHRPAKLFSFNKNVKNSRLNIIPNYIPEEEL
jgi:8-oxo-dGTP diphosphatase